MPVPNMRTQRRAVEQADHSSFGSHGRVAPQTNALRAHRCRRREPTVPRDVANQAVD
jgi:RNase P/RNase MRP subunit p29